MRLHRQNGINMSARYIATWSGALCAT